MKMSVSTRASSEAWKLKPSTRIQRRLPFTTWPRPGISTKNSSATAPISNGQAIFSRYSVRTQNTQRGEHECR
jgi:hypothetical protein